MHDSIDFDDHGKPSVAIITEPFIKTTQAILDIRDLPDYPHVVIPHPLGSLPDEELELRAEQILPQIIKILLG